MFDTHAAVKTLTSAGASDELAEAFVRVAQDAREHLDLATKADLRTETAEVRTEIANLDTRLSTHIADLRAEQRTGIAGVRTEIAESRAEIANLESRLIKWIVGTAIAAAIASASITTVLLRLLGE